MVGAMLLGFALFCFGMFLGMFIGWLIGQAEFPNADE